jgi:hypothetical protein
VCHPVGERLQDAPVLVKPGVAQAALGILGHGEGDDFADVRACFGQVCPALDIDGDVRVDRRTLPAITRRMAAKEGKKITQNCEADQNVDRCDNGVSESR